MKDILLIPNVKIHNANALSSPYTIGFPAMTAWLGFMHALQRKLAQTEFEQIKFTGIIVSCLDMTLHTYKGSGDYVSSIVATSNPLDKSGKRPSFIEEARCDLEVTLAIECDMDFMGDDSFTNFIDKLLHTMKIASGDLMSFKSSRLLEVDNTQPRDLTKYLMPGFCLVSRQELMQKEMEQGNDAIDAMLTYLKTTTDIEIDENHHVKKSKAHNKEKGWIVPIAVGYQGISELGNIENTRDPNTPHRFAESIVTLGEFKMPYHFETIEEMIWRYQEYNDNDLYLCHNSFSANSFSTNKMESKL
ncbi:MAG: type I-F CRISPR-associated protein Csy2 [gamma proteobacterium symbiont of Taylorina sp.]|nr:type I-F CRISPR-associated protein Csy2 [gamma proteobacterium symbiont of Taylorina sp.]